MTPAGIDFRIMWNRLTAVVEEPVTALVRTATHATIAGCRREATAGKCKSTALMSRSK